MSDKLQFVGVVWNNLDKLSLSDKPVLSISHCKTKGKRIIVAFHVSSNQAQSKRYRKSFEPGVVVPSWVPVNPGLGSVHEKGPPKRDACTCGTEMTNE